MAQPLPRLRLNLDFMPSPVEGKPGLLMRDSYGYSDSILIIPPPLVGCLECFDGLQTELDLRQMLVRITGDIEVGEIQKQLVATLSAAGFLHDATYEELRETRHREFQSSAIRAAGHAGTAYPAEPEPARQLLQDYMLGADRQAEDEGLIAIAAPHVSPFGGWETYRAAYSALSDLHKERVFVILGTSHYGEPDRFGLTRKPFETPYGIARPELSLINELADEPAAIMEDYCHAVEHSIEFQVLFLQHLYGQDIRIVPILCGSYARSICDGVLPEGNDNVRRFLDRLGNIAARESNRLLWILGIDMAHIGMRYGDPFAATANTGRMEEVAVRDRARIDAVNAADAFGFWDLIRQNQDDLKWCGSSPIYTFLKAVPNVRGTTRGYQQWNIDDGSVVSFGAVSFRRC